MRFPAILAHLKVDRARVVSIEGVKDVMSVGVRVCNKVRRVETCIAETRFPDVCKRQFSTCFHALTRVWKHGYYSIRLASFLSVLIDIFPCQHVTKLARGITSDLDAILRYFGFTE